MYKKTTTTVEEFFDSASPPIAPMSAARSINPKALKPVIRVDVPLMIRLFEYAREDAVGDIVLHQMVERMIELCQYGEVLEMDDYDDIVELMTASPDNKCMEPPPPPPPPPVG